MLTKRISLISLSLLFALVAFALVSTPAADAMAEAGDESSAPQRRATPTPSPIQTNPPTVSLTPDTMLVTNCPRDRAEGEGQVRLNAAGRSPEGLPLRYRWSASGGRIVGEGPVVTWDLQGAAPGVYTATVEADSGPGCLAFSSATVRVRECPPPICPNITIYCPDTVPVGQPVTFNANISGGDARITPTFTWTVSPGTILSGQGTSSITVDTAGLGGQGMNVQLDVGGYGIPCPANCATQVPRQEESRRFDEYGPIAYDDEKARLDNYAIQLQNEPNAQGYIIVYGGRRGPRGEASRRAARAREYLTTLRGIDSRRLIVLEGPERDVLTTELWIVPTGAAPPTPRGLSGQTPR